MIANRKIQQRRASFAPDQPLERTIERIIGLVEEETAALLKRAPLDWEDFADRKARLLVEFTRAARALGAEPSPSLLAMLQLLRRVLARNQEVLGLHLDAAHQVTRMLHDAIAARESDGTYDALAPAARKKP